MTRVASQISDRGTGRTRWRCSASCRVPCVYYGDEFGLEAVKEQRPSGDDAVRPEMPKERWLFTHSHPEVEQTYRRVIGLRRRNPWLVDAMIETEQVDNARIVIRARPGTASSPGPGPQPDRATVRAHRQCGRAGSRAGRRRPEPWLHTAGRWSPTVQLERSWLASGQSHQRAASPTRFK